MLFVSMRNFLKLCCHRKLFAMLSILSLAITTLNFLVLFEKGLYTYQYNLAQEYVFLESESPEDVVSIYSDIVHNTVFPEITSISLIDKECTGIYYETSQFQVFMPYGRLFSQKELDDGEYVVLLSQEYIRNIPNVKADNIWDDGIDIAGNHFVAIGSYTDIARYFSIEELALDYPMPTLMTIPAKTYLTLGRKPSMLNCQFASVLSSEQRNALMQIFESYESVGYYYIPGTNDALRKSLLETLSSYLLILFMSLMAVALIIIYWFSSERERYKVYLVCGAQKKHIIFFCTMDILLLSLISYIGALAGLKLVNIWFEGVILAALSMTWCMFIGIGIFASCLCIVIFRSLSLLKHYRDVVSREMA